MKVLYGKYVGPSKRLKGKTLIIKTDTRMPDYYLCQFDDVALFESCRWWPFPKWFIELDPA